MSEYKDINNQQGTLEDMQKSLRGINNLRPITESQNSPSTNQNNARTTQINSRKDDGK